MTNFATDAGALVTPMTGPEMLNGLACGTLSIGQLNWLFKQLYAVSSPEKFVTAFQNYNAATNTGQLLMNDGSVVPVDFTAVIADAVASGGTGGAREWYIDPDPAIGNDANTGARGSPFRTLAHLFTVAAPFAVIIPAPNCQFKEQVIAPYPYIWRADGGAPFTFQCFDKLTAVWTVDATYANTFHSTYNQLWGAGYNPAVVAGQGQSQRMLIDGRQLTEVALNTSPVDGFTFSSEAACLAFVNANPGFFYAKQASGGRMEKNWDVGTTELWVHTWTNDSPAVHNVSIGQREAPQFAEYSTIVNPRIFGGVGHNGAIWRNCRVVTPEIWYPLHHSNFCAGSELDDPLVYGGNLLHGGYAFHSFNLSGGTTAKRKTRIRRPKIIDYYGGFNALFGCHGTDGSGNPVIDELIVEGLYAFNVAGLATGSDIKNRVTFIDPVMINAVGMVVDSSTDMFDPVFVSGTMGDTNCFGIGNGETLNVYGGSINAGRYLWQTGGGGTMNFYDMIAHCRGDQPNVRWFQDTGGVTAVTMTRCIVGSMSGDDRNEVFGGYSSNGGSSYAFTDCHLSGIYPAGLPNTTIVRTVVGGKLDFVFDNRGVLSLGPDNVRTLLGHMVVGVATVNTHPYFYGLPHWTLTSKNMYALGSAAVSLQYPLWPNNLAATLNGVVPIVSAAGNFLVVFGDAAKLYRYDWGVTGAIVPVGGRTMNWKHAVNVQDAVNSAGIYNDKTWLLGDDGSITEYEPATNTLTNRASGVAWPMRGGHRMNGNTILAWGGDAVTDTSPFSTGTQGGIIRSTDGGVTWALSLAFGDTFVGGEAVGNMAYGVRCGTYVNGQWVVFGTRGTMLTSPDGAPGSWTVRPLPHIDVRACVAEQTTKKIIFGGSGILRNARTAPLYMLDASPSAVDTSLWKRTGLDHPLHTIKHITVENNAQEYLSARETVRWQITGHFAEYATSSNGYGWERGRLDVNVPTAQVNPYAKRSVGLLPA